MEKLNANNTPITTLRVECTPQDLRTIADRLEAAAAVAAIGDEITYRASSSITLAWQPEKQRMKIDSVDSDDKYAAAEAQAVSTAIN